jgi:hypothetical protein
MNARKSLRRAEASQCLAKSGLTAGWKKKQRPSGWLGLGESRSPSAMGKGIAEGAGSKFGG